MTSANPTKLSFRRVAPAWRHGPESQRRAVAPPQLFAMRKPGDPAVVVDDGNNAWPAEAAGSQTPRWVRWLTTGPAVTPRQSFWAAFAALFLVAAIWAVANPLMASVDEPAHAVMAAATARRAPNIATYYQTTGLGDYATTGVGIVEVPAIFDQLHHLPTCFAQRPTLTAACMPALTGDLAEITETFTSAIDYNPLYYAVVGLPALLPWFGYFTVFLMRFANAALAAVFIAMAVRTVVEMRRRQWLGVALLVTLTPTAVNLLGSINPQSAEVAGTILLWVALLALLTEPDPALTWRRVARVILGALLISNSRGLGPFFTFLIVLLVFAVVPWPAVRHAFADRRVWWALGGGVLVTAIGTAWIFLGGSLPAGTGSGIGWGEALRVTFDAVGWFLFMIIGVLGWLDVAPPQWFYLLGAAIFAFLLVAGFAIGRRRDRRVLALTAALMVLLPIAIESHQARIIGYFWQGRYIFPISMGLIILAGWVIDRYTFSVPQWLQANFIVVLASSFVFLNLVGFMWNLHRYVNGIDGSWLRMGPGSWPPPIPPVPITLMYLLAWLAFAAVVVRSTIGSRLVDIAETPTEKIHTAPILVAA